MCDSDKKEGNVQNDILPSQLFQARMKSHDVIQEHLKQIITVGSATLVLTVSFLKDIIGAKGSFVAWGFLLPFSWVILGIGILVGVIGISLLVNNLDKADTELGRDRKYPKAFAVSSTLIVRMFVLIGIWAFGLGMLSLGVFGARNYHLFLEKEIGGYRIISETQAVETAKKQMPSSDMFVHLTSVKLLNGSPKIPGSMLIWHIQFITQGKTTDTSPLQPIIRDFIVDAFTGETKADN